MSRLEKKCYVGSAGLHLLLLSILFVGPAFLSSRSKTDDMTVLEVVPMKTIDAAFAGGGNPNAKPPPPAPQPPPLPRPAPETVAKPEPPKVIQTAEPDPASLKPTPETKARKPEVSTKLVARSRSSAKQSATSSAELEAQAHAAAKRRGEQLSSTIRSLRDGLSSSTTVEMPGPGGGGPTYASYKQVLASIYYQAWHEPDDASVATPTVVAIVVVARDGTVLSARITKSSGDKAVDRSVQVTLERVNFIAPFPEEAKDEQRQFTVNFNAKAKRGLG